MEFIIKSISGRELWKGDAVNIRDAVEKAVARSADLRSANLQSANLRSANLRYANLRSANLRSANLRYVREDFRAVLETAPNEALFLRRALRLGNVNGSAYEGKCACLVGTIAIAKGQNYRNLIDLKPDADRAAERWFLAINEGDTHRNSIIVAITLEWLDEWLKEKEITIPKRAKSIGEVSRAMANMTAPQRKKILAFTNSVASGG